MLEGCVEIQHNAVSQNVMVKQLIYAMGVAFLLNTYFASCYEFRVLPKFELGEEFQVASAKFFPC